MPSDLKDRILSGPGSAALGLGEGAPRTLASAVFNEIRADILATRLLPGQKLHIGALAARFSVSLGAIREALSRLVTMGLVEAADQKGFRVYPVSLADLQDITRTRIEIEGLALKFSIEEGGANWADRIRQSFGALRAVPHLDPADPMRHNPTWIVLHEQFHAALVAACPLQWLMRFRTTLYEQSERYRGLSVPLSPTRRDVDAEHARIVDAALDRDVPAALAALSDHLSLTMEIVLQGAPQLQQAKMEGWPS
ncbi:MAG TPA: GntR family transcriptional regulator [Stellaceae bacterium]|jgi:DNA-binding GntR family transcriptional regulator|nr:GntR family transcriptional regulator [Stellaceae bacterium]